MKIIVDEIDTFECPLYYYGECHCGQYKVNAKDGDPD